MSAQKPKGKETNVQRIIVRHTKGSKAGQLEEFPINMYNELNIGRDASSTIKFDPETDDLVSRHHAKIVKDKIDPTQFSIMDVGSANGTFVNKQKIFSQTRIQPGDRIQLGPGGPEFEFDLAPRPTEVKKTRLATGQGTQSPTRTFEGSVVTTGTKPGYKTTFGKNTVMQMMAKARGESRKLIGAGVGILAVIIALTVFYFVKTDKSQELEVKIIGVERRVGEAEKNKPMTGAQIARKYEKSVVHLRVSWHLIHTPSRQKVYQLYLPWQEEEVAIYENRNDKIVPYLIGETSDLLNPHCKPIGQTLGGTGFVVTQDGFIITNKHVAAPWLTNYPLQRGTFLKETIKDGKVEPEPDFKSVIEVPPRWKPAEGLYFGGIRVSKKTFEGQYDYCDVTFAKTDMRIPAKLARISSRHDVALLKIDVPETLTAARLEDSKDRYESIRQGEQVFAMGYPSVSPGQLAVTKSSDVGMTSGLSYVQEPSIAEGIIGKIIRDAEAQDDFKLIGVGDYYQLSGAMLGCGASGGPLFDNKGVVIGIYSKGIGIYTESPMSLAVPVKYALDLIEGKSIGKQYSTK